MACFLNYINTLENIILFSKIYITPKIPITNTENDINHVRNTSMIFKVMRKNSRQYTTY